MQISDGSIDHAVPRIPPRREALPARRRGTIPVTVRLDPPRYDRLKRLVQRFSTTGQSIIQTALDRSMLALERQRAPTLQTDGQSTLFDPEPQLARSPRPAQDSFAFLRPEPTVAVTYRASVLMHHWLHQRSHDTGQTIQDIITNALKAARGYQ